MKTVILKTWMRPTMPGKTGESRRKLHRSCVRRPLGGKARQRQAMCAHGKPLPCVCAVELERAALAGNFAAVPAHLFWVLGYAVVVTALAVCLFLCQMKRQ